MLNLYKVRKWGGLILIGLLTTMSFYIGMAFYGGRIFYGLLFMFGGLFVSVLLGNLMIKTPFSEMLEGKGILTLNIDSTGVIRPFIVALKSPFVMAKFGGKWIRDTFNRKATFMLSTPIKAKNPAEIQKDGGIVIKLNNEEYNAGRFALYNYPTFIYNQQLSSMVTKDFLCSQEISLFAEHQVLYLNRQLEDLTSNIRNFGRYIVDNLKPKRALGGSMVFWIILIIVIIVLAILFVPSILKQFGIIGGNAGGVSEAVKSTLGSVAPS